MNVERCKIIINRKIEMHEGACVALEKMYKNASARGDAHASEIIAELIKERKAGQAALKNLLRTIRAEEGK